MCRSCGAIVGAGETQYGVCGASTAPQPTTQRGSRPPDKETIRFARAVLNRPYKFTIIFLIANVFVFLLMWDSSGMSFRVLQRAFSEPILVMYGALNNISRDVIEAARVDGAGPVRTAWFIQIPLLRKWISYMVILSFAGGTQLFVEPRVLSQASRGVVSQDYSLNQLAFLYAFKQSDFNGSAAISLVLLVVSLGLSIYFVFRGGLFERV